MTLFRITTGESWNGVLHVLIRGAFISHSYLGHDCIGHNCVGHHYIGLLRDLVRGACMYEDDKFKLGCGGPAQAYLFMYSFIFFGCLIVFNLFVAVILDNMATVDIEEDHPLCPHEFARMWARFDPFSHYLLPVGQVSFSAICACTCACAHAHTHTRARERSSRTLGRGAAVPHRQAARILAYNPELRQDALHVNIARAVPLWSRALHGHVRAPVAAVHQHPGR